MKANRTKLASLLMCGILGFTSLSLYGCDSGDADPSDETTAASAATDEEQTEPSDDTDTDSADDTVTPMQEALDIADRVGLTDLDLRGEYELFLEFSECVENNPNLGDFRGYIYNLFPIVADQLEDDNKEAFFEKLRGFSISWGAPDGSAAAYYASASNEVVLGMIDSAGEDGVFVLSIYHELIHFIDGTIDGDPTYVYYLNDGSFVDSSEADTIDPGQVTAMIGDACFTEGGAEYYLARYFNGAPTAYSYYPGTVFLSGIEYIFGPEGLDDLFFHHDTMYRFYQLLEENDFTSDEIYRAMNGINNLIDSNTYTPDQLMNPQEILIRLYLNNIGPDYLNDQVFCDILAHYSETYFGSVSSDYVPVDMGADYFTERADRITSDVNDQFYNGETEVHLMSNPIPVNIDGEIRYVCMFFTFGGNDDEGQHTLIIDYDFETGEARSYEIEAGNWFPGDPFETVSSDDTPEGQALIDELSVDNSEAHDQTASGSNDDLQDLYERSAQVGSDHGVYIWYDDLVPEGIITEGSEATDPDRISDAIDKIETVLELYPEDYFDQLLFRYYSGFVICLYDGPYDVSLTDYIYTDGKYYMTVFIDLQEYPEFYAPGVEFIRSTYFSNADDITTELITDIWSCTEKFFINYNNHFDSTSVSEETWDETNHSYFYYSDSEDDFWIDVNLEYDDPDYLLCRESVISAKNDRLLTYEYMMLSAWEEHTGGTLPVIMTDACKNKAAELMRAMRAIFRTDNWPAQTTWESVEL